MNENIESLKSQLYWPEWDKNTAESLINTFNNFWYWKFNSSQNNELCVDQEKIINFLISLAKSKQDLKDTNEEIKTWKERVTQQIEEKHQEKIEDWTIIPNHHLAPYKKANSIDKNELIYLIQSVFSQIIIPHQEDQSNREWCYYESKNLFFKANSNTPDQQLIEAVWIYPQNITKEILEKLIGVDCSNLKWNQLYLAQLKAIPLLQEILTSLKPVYIPWENRYTYKACFIDHPIAKGKIIDFSKTREYYSKKNHIMKKRIKIFDNLYEYLENIQHIWKTSKERLETLDKLLEWLSFQLIAIKSEWIRTDWIENDIKQIREEIMYLTNKHIRTAVADRISKLWYNHLERLSKQLSWAKLDTIKRIWEISRIIERNTQIERLLIQIHKNQKQNLTIALKSLNYFETKKSVGKKQLVVLLNNFLSNLPNYNIRPFCKIKDEILEIVWNEYENLSNTINKQTIAEIKKILTKHYESLQFYHKLYFM